MVKDLKLYQILDISPNASQKDIDQAYRRLAMKYHPDRHTLLSEDEQQLMINKFKEISKAKEILSDSKLRILYDQTGETQPKPNLSSVFKRNSSKTNPFVFPFSQTRNHYSKCRIPPIKINLKISLEDAYNGKTTIVNYERSIQCQDCLGCGGTDIEICPDCRGNGMINKDQKIGKECVTRKLIDCKKCHGKGELIGNKCLKCNGNGKIGEKVKQDVFIPKGSKTGDIIELKGKGTQIGLRYDPGDVEIIIEILSHIKFKQQGNNLIYNANIHLFEALCGGTMIIEHLGGHQIIVKLKKIIQPNQLFYIHQEGMPIKDTSDKGDLIVKINIQFPGRLTEEEREKLAILLKRKVVLPKIKENHYETELKPYHGKIDIMPQQTKPPNGETNTFYVNGMSPEAINGIFGANFSDIINNIVKTHNLR